MQTNEHADRAAMNEELLRLVEQSLWANRRWADLVYAQPEEDVRPRELLGHIMVTERVWFERIEGAQKSSRMFPVLSKEELLRGFEENRLIFQTLIASRLSDVIHFRRGSGEEYHARVIDIVQHLLTHGYHHRGQLAALFARTGIPYPSTDHIDFLMENRL